MSSYNVIMVRKREKSPTSTIRDIVCVCCLVKNIRLIPMNTCEHVDIYKKLLDIKLESTELWVCHTCHQMMKKFYYFREQIQNSYRILTSLNEEQTIHLKKAINLSMSKSTDNTAIFYEKQTAEFNRETETFKLETQEDSISDSSATDTALVSHTHKAEVFPNDVKIEIKIENEIEIEDNPLELPTNEPSSSNQQKTKHKRLNPKTKESDSTEEGKIVLKVLNREEIEEERRNDALKPLYVKLRYKCEDCIVAFDFKQNLDEHLEKRHNKNNGSHQCAICKTYYQTNSVCNKHMARHYNRYECSVCHRMLRSKRVAILHYESVHENIKKIYHCGHCEHVTDSVRKYNYHIEKHKGIHQCTECHKSFVTKSGVKSHMLLIHNKSRLMCNKCPKSFASRSGLTNHILTHSDGRTAFCVTCKKVYASIISLNNHLKHHKAHRNESDHKFICEDCGEKFTMKSLLREHIEWKHLNIIKHRCHVCDKPFKNYRVMKRHIMFVHDKQKLIKNKICDYCGAAFSTSRLLTIHIRTHTGERPLQCTVCPATFAHPAALYNHNKIHK